MQEVREITDYKEWDTFVDNSPQGTIFSTTEWMQLYDVPWKVWGYYKNSNLVGGICSFEKPQPLTPFQGILTIPTPDMKYANIISLQNEVATALLYVVPQEFTNHYMYPDIRPFLWNGFSASVRYTYVVDITNLSQLWANLEKSTRYDITRAQRSHIVLNKGIEGGFFLLYTETFKRKGLDVPVSESLIKKIYKIGMGYSAFDAQSKELLASAIVIFDKKRAYYILAASAVSSVPSLLLWEIFKDVASMGYKEMDLVGCNDQNIALYKRGFGGKLMPYYNVRRSNGKDIF